MNMEFSRHEVIERNKEVERIIRVDHAGELGAISIYKSQLFVSRYLYKDIAPELSEMLSHEKEHFETFDKLLKKRSVRPCYALWLWAVGGLLLGSITALLGRNAIWVCTNAVETTVLHHLKWQLRFLKENDREAYEAVFSIKMDEESHQEKGAKHGSLSLIYKPIFLLVSGSTKIAIWLSAKI